MLVRFAGWPRALLDLAAAAICLVVLGAGTGACSEDPPLTSSAFHLDAEPCLGTIGQRASGTAIGPDLVATVAHSLDGSAGFALLDSSGAEVGAAVVYLDPVKDVALLRLDEPADHHLPLAAPEGPGPVSLVSYGTDDGPEVREGRLLELVDATLEGEGRRAAAKLSADIEAGDSGAAVVDPDGRMVAMVFATVRGVDRGWAISATELEAAVENLDGGGPGDGPPAC